MKRIEVVAAVIRRNNEILSTKRGYGEFQGGWEFPGGKIEEGEKPEEALIREIKEELDMVVEVGELIGTVEYDYPKFHLTMQCYFCSIVTGNLVLKEHEDAKWLGVEELDSVAWLPADVEIIGKIRKKMKKVITVR